jgi:MYXO-CTERM domain-containing protein
MQPRRRLAHAGLALAAALALAAPRPAAACGGFFCSTSPVEQQGEKILFFTGQNEMEVDVEITYSGSARDFAWIVPVPKVPRLGVGVNAIFATLEPATRPRFQLEWKTEGMCGQQSGGERDSLGAPTASPSGSTPPMAPGVSVVAQEQVGPYDSVILQANDGAALDQWLRANGYNVTPQAVNALAPYLGTSYFVALRLQSDRETGDITPITLTFESSEPCIPLRLTAIAAQADMSVTAWILGPARAIPTNYNVVTLNEALIDWIGGGQNYKQVVSRAADEGMGNAFTTEWSGATTPFKGMFFREGQYDVARLARIADPVAFLAEMLRQGFPRDAQVRAMLRRFIPMPAAVKASGVTEQQFYNSLSQYASQLGPFDAAAFAAALDAEIVKPLARAQTLFDAAPYMTRLFTLISPEEMTVDPIFDYNPDLRDWDGVRKATAVLECGDGLFPYTGRPRVRIELADGRKIYLNPDAKGGYDRGDLDKMPAAQQVLKMSTSGAGQVVKDNGAAIQKLLDDHNRRVREDDSGCAASPGEGASGTAFGVLAALGILALRARRLVRRR